MRLGGFCLILRDKAGRKLLNRAHISIVSFTVRTFTELFIRARPSGLTILRAYHPSGLPSFAFSLVLFLIRVHPRKICGHFLLPLHYHVEFSFRLRIILTLGTHVN